MLPFRRLIKPGETFEWTAELDDVFMSSKDAIVSEIMDGVRIFDKTKPTCLATDWSKDGIGFWLFQKHCQCLTTDPFCCADGWTVEGEALAVTNALDKAHYFVLGCSDLVIAVDHKPLLKLFGNRSLDDIPNASLANDKTCMHGYIMTKLTYSQLFWVCVSFNIMYPCMHVLSLARLYPSVANKDSIPFYLTV